MGTENKEPIDRMAFLNKKLDEYEVSLGLPLYIEGEDHNEAKKLLNYNRNQMEQMSIEDCAQAALLLGGLSFYIQRAINRETAVINWADSTLKGLLSGKEVQFKGSWESQFNQAIKNDDYTNKLHKLRIYAQNRHDRLIYLASSIKNMSDLFVNLQRAKATK